MYTDVCIALYAQCFPSVCEKYFTGDSGGTRTHDLLPTKLNKLFITRRKNSPTYNRGTRCYNGILAGQSSLGGLGGRVVGWSGGRVVGWSGGWDVCTSGQEVAVRVPPESPVKYFSQTLGKH